MARCWTESIRTQGTLRYALRDSVTHSVRWARAVDHAVREFNALSRRHRLSVRLSQARGNATAEVILLLGSGQVRVQAKGIPKETQMNPSRLHGRTLIYAYECTGRIFKAFVVLPANPQINTPRGLRAAGSRVLIAIALHELIHACGLGNDDHASYGIFQGFPQVDAGDTPAGDRMRTGRWSGGRPGHMPPFVLDPTSVQNLRGIWTLAEEVTRHDRDPLGLEKIEERPPCQNSEGDHDDQRCHPTRPPG